MDILKGKLVGISPAVSVIPIVQAFLGERYLDFPVVGKVRV